MRGPEDGLIVTECLGTTRFPLRKWHTNQIRLLSDEQGKRQEPFDRNEKRYVVMNRSRESYGPIAKGRM